MKDDTNLVPRTIMIVSFIISVLLAVIPFIMVCIHQHQQDKLIREIEQQAPQISIIPMPTASTVLPDNDPSASHPDDVPAADETEYSGIGILTIECIDLKLPVTHGASDAQLNIAVGWIPETQPIGSAGNAIIAGHRARSFGRLFYRLDELAAGDIVEYQPATGKKMRFEVVEVFVTDPDDPKIINAPDSGAYLTLITCTPIRTGTHRLVARAVLL